MLKSNVDISKLPKFTSLNEAEAYFNRFGKMKFWGWETPLRSTAYAIYTFTRNNGTEYFIDIQEDGEISVRQRGTEMNRDFQEEPPTKEGFLLF